MIAIPRRAMAERHLMNAGRIPWHAIHTASAESMLKKASRDSWAKEAKKLECAFLDDSWARVK